MLNKCEFIGNLGKDVELRYTQSGKAVATLAIGCSEKVGNEKRTEWVTAIVWEKTAESAAKYLSKGSKVYVEGRMQTRKWQDKDGNDKYSTEIIASKLIFLDSRPTSAEAGRVEQVADLEDVNGDAEIPF